MTITRTLIAALSISLALISCGGGGGSTAGSVGGTSVAPATVAIALTDAPSSSYDQALATITSIQLLGNGAPVALFIGVGNGRPSEAGRLLGALRRGE